MYEKIGLPIIYSDVRIISISVDKSKDDWIKSENKLSIPWPSFITDTATMKKYDVRSVPAYFVIRKDGEMINIGSSLSVLYQTIKRESTDNNSLSAQ